MRSGFLVVAWSAIQHMVSANPAPLQTPAPNVNPDVLRRQEITSGAASSFATRTFAYYSGGETEGLVLWAPITYQSEIFSFTSSGPFWRGCSSTFYATIGTSVSADTACPMFTTCSDGWLVAASTSYYCVQQTLSCYTELLYSTYGASDALSWLYCGTSSENATNTAYYRTKPAADIVATSAEPKVTPSDNNDSKSTPSPGPTTPANPGPTSPIPTPPPESGAGGKKSNAGAIAGGVVGGIAVLALAGIAIFFLVFKKKKGTGAAASGATAPPPTSGTAQYPSDAKPANVQVGEYYPQAMPMQGQAQGGYDPHQSGVYSQGSTSPTVMNAVPPYEPHAQPHQAGPYRNELPS